MLLWVPLERGPDRISRRVIIKNMSCGGLRMVQLPAFIKALKISWIRRIIKPHENNEWFDFSTVNFSKLLSMGTQYAERLTETLINPFWKDLMKHWSDFGKVVRIENIKQIIQGSPGVGRNTFLSSHHLCFIILFICDLFVSRDDPLMS